MRTVLAVASLVIISGCSKPPDPAEFKILLDAAYLDADVLDARARTAIADTRTEAVLDATRMLDDPGHVGRGDETWQDFEFSDPAQARLQERLDAIDEWVREEEPWADDLTPEWRMLRDAHDALRVLAAEAVDPLRAQAEPIENLSDAEARVDEREEATREARARWLSSRGALD